MVRQRLFNSKGILSVIRKRREDLEVKLKKYDSDELLRTSDTDVIEWLISECILDVPRLGKPRVVDYGDTSIDVGEKEVEISGIQKIPLLKEQLLPLRFLSRVMRICFKFNPEYVGCLRLQRRCCMNAGNSMIPLILRFLPQKRNLLIPLGLSGIMQQRPSSIRISYL